MLHCGTTEEISGTGLDVVVAIGKSGREEITDCIRRLAENSVPPSAIDEKMLESCLTFRYDPDIVVKTGDDHLTDFLIWQSVYSELSSRMSTGNTSGAWISCGCCAITSPASAGSGSKNTDYFIRILIQLGTPATDRSARAYLFLRATKNTLRSGIAA